MTTENELQTKSEVASSNLLSELYSSHDKTYTARKKSYYRLIQLGYSHNEALAASKQIIHCR